MHAKEDIEFMRLALAEAQAGLDEGNFPVGAVLVIGNKLIDKGRNSIKTNSDWISHAEMLLLHKNSVLIKKSRKEKLLVTLYTTLEPCLMCFGAAVLHRISRIVYACSDPYTGATCVKLESLPVGYKEMWPASMEEGPFGNESQGLILQFTEKQGSAKWDKMSSLIEDGK
jgi:tRNA(adenine34) deaminase